MAIYAPDGTYITTLVDGVESDVTNEYGRFAVVYRSYTGTYVKVICASQEGDYRFEIIGKDDGLVNFEMATTVNDAINTYNFTNVETSEGTVLKTGADAIVSNQTYEVDADGDGSIDYQQSVQLTGESYIPVETIDLNQQDIEIQEGESTLLTVSITPDNATRQNVIWVSDNEDVVSINDGKVVGNSAGTATILCVSQDNTELFAACNVVVSASLEEPSVTFTENEDALFFDISVSADENKYTAYAVIYDENGKLLNSKTEQLSTNGSVFIELNRPANATYAAVFIWDCEMRPITIKWETSL